MLLKKLKTLIKQGESDVLEFKKSTAELGTAMQVVCSFLNSEHGGTVLIGVTDDGRLVGQAVTDKTRKEIANELHKFEPHAEIVIEYVELSERLSVIVFLVKSGNKAPYVYDGRAYVRSESTTWRMPQELYEHLLQKRDQPVYAWDNAITNDCTIDDLDKKRIRDVVRMGIEAGRITDLAARASIPEILKKLKLMRGERLTNAAVVLFCKNEYKQFLQAEVKLARFLGLDKSEFLDNKIYRDNVFELLERALQFLSNHLPIAGRVEDDKIQRTDTPAIPFKVLREALVNALCHRDYAMRSGDISVAIYDDRVEIISAGRLPPGIKLSALKALHESYPRNNLIADVFFSCDMIERWGRGTLDMVKFCKEAGNPVPRFAESTGSFLVTLPLKEPMRQFARANTAIVLTDRQKEIFAVLKKHGPLSCEQIVEKIDVVLSARVLQKELLKLKELRLVTFFGKTPSIQWLLIAD